MTKHPTLNLTLKDWLTDYHSLPKLFTQLNQSTSIKAPDETPQHVQHIPGLDIQCGPILKLAGTLENKSRNYRGSILLVTKDANTNIEPVITYLRGPLFTDNVEHITEGQFHRVLFNQEQGFSFWRFEYDLQLSIVEEKIRYTVNGNEELTFEFYLPRYDQTMNVMSFSCNGFSLTTDTESFKSSLWFDVIRKHYQDHRYHVMIGGGDQIYCDSIKFSSQLFNDWLEEKNPLKKRHQKLTPELVASFNKDYLRQYLAWFGQGHWKGLKGTTLQPMFPFAMCSIPSINIYDDHDIIDGYGSYHESTMANEVFKGLGMAAYKYYMLFQHHTSMDESSYLKDPSWILGQRPGPSITELSHSVYTKLGQDVAFLGLDCRTERKLRQVVSEETYRLVFNRLESEISQDPKIKHLYVLLGVPIAYPRLVWLELLLGSRLLAPLKYLASKNILMDKSVLNEFDGSVEILDDLNDHWCSRHHKRERNKFIAKLQKFGAKHAVRITILSGDVHLAAIGRFKTKQHRHRLFEREKYTEHNNKVRTSPETDPRLIINIISSAIINTPPPDAMAALLNQRSKLHHFDYLTDEDMIPLFTKDTDDSERPNKEFLNKRNWSDLIPLSNIENFDTPIGNGKLPGPVTGHPQSLEIRADRELKYTVTPNCVISTIHVERDREDVQSLSSGYEVVIPELTEKSILRGVGLKSFKEYAFEAVKSRRSSMHTSRSLQFDLETLPLMIPTYRSPQNYPGKVQVEPLDGVNGPDFINCVLSFGPRRGDAWEVSIPSQFETIRLRINEIVVPIETIREIISR
ncbi:hypothetical protein WICPIJ_001540 [Wickerhamomyces pijperi]|uniref:PhoD-like phosphatase domain-containing protein n=1 Tax=Wickerhamomyces pijperi TaxID=599730 RepID=A0A9P8QAM3_WICPI|nr:hypothetical protein WICPIJ_001540 [Wickerhamomyces pijperi]